MLISVSQLQQALLERPVILLRALMADPVNGKADTGDADFLPNTVNVDLDSGASDHGSGLPHTFPGPEELSNYLGELGITANSELVIYDNRGLFTAPRLWWMLKAIGHENVRVLDGGLPAWKAAGLSTLSRPMSLVPTTYTATAHSGWFVNSDSVLSALNSPTQILDARSADRFFGRVEEPRPGLRSGHMPGALNIPFPMLLKDQQFLSADALKAVFVDAGVNLSLPVLCSCGSGVTACIVGMAALLCGASDVSVYDGSWAEWGGDSRFPVEN